jgi:hypothetical protein
VKKPKQPKWPDLRVGDVVNVKITQPHDGSVEVTPHVVTWSAKRYVVVDRRVFSRATGRLWCSGGGAVDRPLVELA